MDAQEKTLEAGRKKALIELVEEYKTFKATGRLALTSEQTIRGWLDRLLAIFGWDVRDTQQILQEKMLSKTEQAKLKSIGSPFKRPDYTFRLATEKLTFLDAKDLAVRLEDDATAAFQIKSYGWSIQAPCAFLSNFEEFVIYDCTSVPKRDDKTFFGRIYLKLDDYETQFEKLDRHLFKDNVLSGRLRLLYEKPGAQKITLDYLFAEQLSNFRTNLANHILENNPSLQNDLEGLSYVVQTIINRVLFIRVCEARKIEEEGLLKTFLEQGFWQKFKTSSYADFYKRYDGFLFERHNAIHQLIIPDEAFQPLVEWLYYPSPYRFDVIPTRLFSDVYELFLSKKLKIEHGKASDEFKNEYLKTKGAVSTPRFLVREIIKRTIIRESLLQQGIERLLDSKVLDIACGSGAFMIEVYDYLEDVIRELFYAGNLPETFQAFLVPDRNDFILTLEGRKLIFDHCIFGVDIDPEAAEVAKLSIALKIIEATEFAEQYGAMGLLGDKILNGVGTNVKCGNSLVSSDILEHFPGLHQKEAELAKTNIFDWERESGFAEIFSNKCGFDYIVGNPPYVEVKNYNIDLPSMHLYLKKKYATAANNKIDLAVPFLERAFSLLNEKGQLGFIIQKRLFKTEYGSKIREMLAPNLTSIVDFQATSIFKKRTTYVAILILSKCRQPDFFYKSLPEEPDLLPLTLLNLSTPEIDKTPYLKIPATAISSSPWGCLDQPEILELKSRLSQKGILGQYLQVKVGIQALWNDAYQIRVEKIEKELVHGKTSIEKKVIVEQGACRPLFANERFFSFCPDNTDLQVLFPYEVKNGKSSPILSSDYSRRFPLAGAYLLQNKSLIRQNVKTKDSDETWHLFTREQNHHAVYPKVLVPMTALDTYATVTFSDRLYCDNANVFFLDVPQKTKASLYAVAAIFNSTLFSVFARCIALPQQNGYFKFNKQFLEPVPFPVRRFQENYGNLANQLAVIAEQIEIQQKSYLTTVSKQKKASLSAPLRKLWERLNDLVYELYELEEKDIELLKQRGRNKDYVEILN